MGIVTVRDALRVATERLVEAGIPTPRLDAEVLLAHVLGARREHLYAHPERRLDAGEYAAYQAALERRLTRLPVAYITGRKEFMSLEFLVDENVLIPRPETETLVEAVIERLRGHEAEARDGGGGRAPVIVADIGTGSGAIAVSVAWFVRHASLIAVDISPGALRVARENARRHGVEDRIEFLEGDLLSPLAGRGLEGGIHAVVSNPPYLSRRMMASLPPEVAKEPRAALAGGDAGLDFAQAILDGARAYLAADGFVALEVGHDQAETVRRLAVDEFGYGGVDVIRDYAGVERVVIARTAHL
ncbi:MAG: peptide chain release factor N(5)-glutamine methyltransferase [Firmicutes bacterium]|nr:peptide chain release factor N(5)-glutamine methyltransferase [Bacillota bacterium]